ncbi:protein FAM228A isoform X2 [Haplochromis burtoni]|uniref:protein FAM228A isoform X2 n=1 Tax=Haplochromis burtoni TaxID=8153 RepID=UPI001C2D43F7|nr:protein FAM228A isoform X2 [Haplochromis burtoni]
MQQNAEPSPFTYDVSARARPRLACVSASWQRKPSSDGGSPGGGISLLAPLENMSLTPGCLFCRDVEMSHMKKKGPSGLIAVHSPFPVSLLKSEECVTDVKHTTESKKSRRSSSQQRERTRSTCRSVTPEKRNEVSYVPEWATKRDWLSYTSLRQLQAKMKAEKQQVKEILQPLQETENGFIKELEFYLSQRDVTELRRRELLHKHWTEHVWFPIQQRVKAHVSSCPEAKRRHNLYNHYLHVCNSKGNVFLETYDPQEYDPLLLNIKMQQGSLGLRLNERPTGKRFYSSLGSAERRTKSHRPLSESVKSQANKRLHASSKYPACGSIKRPVVVETDRSKCSRPNTIPLHISATATSDGRCHQTSCWFSRCGCLQEPSS